jgi:hypothetical protein
MYVCMYLCMRAASTGQEGVRVSAGFALPEDDPDVPDLLRLLRIWFKNQLLSLLLHVTWPVDRIRLCVRFPTKTRNGRALANELLFRPSGEKPVMARAGQWREKETLIRGAGVGLGWPRKARRVSSAFCKRLGAATAARCLLLCYLSHGWDRGLPILLVCAVYSLALA